MKPTSTQAREDIVPGPRSLGGWARDFKRWFYLAWGIGAICFLAVSFWVGLKRARLATAQKVLVEAKAELETSLELRETELVTRLATLIHSPILKAAAGTGDFITMAHTLQDIAPPSSTQRYFWVQARGPELPGQMVLELGPKTAKIALDRTPANQDLFDFDAAPGPISPGPESPEALPEKLPEFDVSVGPLEVTTEEELVASLVHEHEWMRGTTQGDDPMIGSRLLDYQGQHFLVRSTNLVYEGREFVGVLAIGEDLSPIFEALRAKLPALHLEEALEAKEGALFPLRQPPSPSSPDPFAAWPPLHPDRPQDPISYLSPWLRAQALLGKAGDGRVYKALLWGEIPKLGSDWWVGGASLPWVALGVGILLVLLFSVPLAILVRVQEPPPATVYASRAEILAASGVQATGLDGRSAIAKVLENFPEERYGKASPLGQGGMAMVLKLEDSERGHPIALKVMTISDTSEEIQADLRKRFLREARTLAELDHPGLPKVFEVAQEPAPHFTMEYIEGSSLQDLLDEVCPRSPEEVKAWITEAAKALDHAHSKAIIHRDLKPENMMLSPDGSLRVIDFGIALVEDATRVTRAGYFVGTMGFVSPEQISHVTEDLRTDVYSLASTAYYLLTGRYPYNTAQLAIGRGFQPPLLPEHFPLGLREAVRLGLQMVPDDRPQTMQEFLAILEEEVDLTPPDHSTAEMRRPDFGSPEASIGDASD